MTFDGIKEALAILKIAQELVAKKMNVKSIFKNLASEKDLKEQ